MNLSGQSELYMLVYGGKRNGTLCSFDILYNCLNWKVILKILFCLNCRWYAKRFLHPDIVASYEYIFIWDEDLGVEHFNAEEYAFDLH